MGPRHDLSFCVCTTAWLASELIISMGPSPHLWFMLAKQRLLDQTYKSVLVPDITCRFVHAKQRHFHQNDISIWVPALICVFFFKQNSDFRSRLTSLYGSQTSSVELSARIKRLYVFQPSRVVLCMQISDFSPWITSLYWTKPSSVIFACKTATFGPAYKSLLVPDLTCRFVHVQERA